MAVDGEELREEGGRVEARLLVLHLRDALELREEVGDGVGVDRRELDQQRLPLVAQLRLLRLARRADRRRQAALQEGVDVGGDLGGAAADKGLRELVAGGALALARLDEVLEHRVEQLLRHALLPLDDRLEEVQQVALDAHAVQLTRRAEDGLEGELEEVVAGEVAHQAEGAHLGEPLHQVRVPRVRRPAHVADAGQRVDEELEDVAQLVLVVDGGLQGVDAEEVGGQHATRSFVAVAVLDQLLAAQRRRQRVIEGLALALLVVAGELIAQLLRRRCGGKGDVWGDGRGERAA